MGTICPYHADPAPWTTYRAGDGGGQPPGPSARGCGRRSRFCRPMWSCWRRSTAEAMRPPNGGTAAPDLEPVRRVYAELAQRRGRGGRRRSAWIARIPAIWRTSSPRTSPCGIADKQAILEELSPWLRLRKLNGFLARESETSLGYEREMEGKVRDAAGASTQREQILPDADPGPAERAGRGRGRRD